MHTSGTPFKYMIYSVYSTDTAEQLFAHCYSHFTSILLYAKTWNINSLANSMYHQQLDHVSEQQSSTCHALPDKTVPRAAAIQEYPKQEQTVLHLLLHDMLVVLSLFTLLQLRACVTIDIMCVTTHHSNALEHRHCVSTDTCSMGCAYGH